MSPEVPFAMLSALFAGLLAGEEFVICYGVRAPVGALDPIPSIELRQALIRRLRILVPILVAASTLAGLAATLLGHPGPAAIARLAGLGCLLLFIVVTLTGTVPINQAALAWIPSAPPDGWRLAVRRWERLDNVRTWAAVCAFVLLVIALVMR